MADLIQECKDCANDPDSFIQKWADMSSTFTVAAIFAIYGYVLSIRYGTPEMMVGYCRLAAKFGAIGAACAITKKYLSGELPLPENKSLQTTT